MLVDTGAEFNLVRRGLFSMDDVTPAEFPVETVSGEPIGGGDLVRSLCFGPFARAYGSDDV